MRHLFIVNPAAGGKKSRYLETVRTIGGVMEELGEPYETYITKAPLDAVGKIRREAETGEALRVYACGGDGTLNECVNGAAGFQNVAVTHYPTGTGNDFVKTFGPDDARRFRDLRALTGGFERELDLIEVCSERGFERYGISICSVGIDARIGTDVHKYSGMPILGGPTGYVVSLAVNIMRGINQPFRITSDHEVHTGRFALVCACNGRFYGGGFNPVPEAMPDDGLLDFLICGEVSRSQFLAFVMKYAKGRYREMNGIITHIRGNTITIESEKELVVNVDGEKLDAFRITFRCLPGGVRFLFPENTSFFNHISPISCVFVR